MKKNEKIVLGIVGGIFIIAAVMLWPKKAKAETVPKKDPVVPPKKDPIVPPKKDPEPPKPSGPDPWNPNTTPKKGAYYAVQKGDTMLGIINRAGFEQARRYAAYQSMLNSPKNAWIGIIVDEKQNAGFRKLLRFYMRFEAGAGYENKPYAYNTAWMAKSSHKWPVVWVPGDDEVA